MSLLVIGVEVQEVSEIWGFYSQAIRINVALDFARCNKLVQSLVTFKALKGIKRLSDDK